MSSCSTTKHVPQGQYLLNKENLKVEGKGVKKNDLEALVRQRPNKKIFTLRFNLWLYNLSSVSKDRKIDQFFQNIGEAPVIYDSIQSVVSLRRIEQYASFRGYYNTKAEVDVKYRKKKANVEYRVTLSEPYIIRNISYSILDTTVDTSFITDTQKRLIHEGNVFDGQMLEAETNRINQEMRNRGYYQFHKGYLSYQADTMVGDKQVDIRLIMQKEQVLGFDEPQNHRRYYIKSLGVNADYDLSAALNNSRYAITGWDTMNVYDMQMYYKNKPGLKPDIAAINNTIKIGHLYSEQDVSRTYSNFSNLRLFKSINIRFFEPIRDTLSTPDSAGLLPLQGSIVMSPFTLQSYNVGGEISMSGNGLWGVTGTVSYQHKNLFRGAEIFDASVYATFQKVQLYKDDPLDNSIEVGASVALNIPKFLVPLKLRFYRSVYSPRTQIALSADYQKRPDYTRTLGSISFGYSWRNLGFMTYIFNPIDFNIINIEKNSDRFFNSIKNDPYLMSSYQNTFLLGSTFSSIYKRSFKGDQFYLRFNTDLKGNLLWLGSKIFNAKQAEEVLDEDTQEKHNFYQILETKFAQYAKFDLNITYTKQLNDITSLATRFFGGVGFAYGNSYSLPFDKMYYVGGAYSMRGWQIRTLGPGSYAPDTAGNILNHLADMRLEANVEYRFKLFWKLEGAVFLDAGNIWTISSKDNRENVRFTLRDFPRQIAINWGLGLRLNFNFLVVRLDYGIQLHDPKNSKYFNAPNVWFKSNNNTYSIALGYPF